jgi:hypothetical protein
LVARLRTFREHGVHVLGSFIFGLPSDRPSTFQATADVANRAELAFAQFVMLTPYPGTVDFEAWEKRLGPDAAHVGGVPITRHWLIPREQRPKVYARQPVMSADEIRARTQAVWDEFYSLRRIWGALPMHADTPGSIGLRADLEAIPADVREHRHRDHSARVSRATHWARLIAKPCRRLFVARPLRGTPSDDPRPSPRRLHASPGHERVGVSAKPSVPVMMVRTLGSTVLQPRLSSEDVLYWQSDIF